MNFVLILVFVVNMGGSVSAVRVGEYMSRAQCEAAAPRDVWHHCIPVPRVRT